MPDKISILFLGDVIGRPGRKILEKYLRPIVKKHSPSLIIANGENAAGGLGITEKVGQELLNEIDVLTSGNHIWDKKEAIDYLAREPRLLRPANYPPQSPGKGTYVFEGLREQVWNIVRDPEVLATALPGTQSLEQVSENEYAGKMHVRIGPVSGVFSGRLVVSDEVPPESYTLSVDGRGAPGFAKGTGHVRLLEHEGERTLMEYEGEMQVGGKIASVGQRLIDTKRLALEEEADCEAEEEPEEALEDTA